MFDCLIICFNGDTFNTGFTTRVRAISTELTGLNLRLITVRFVPMFHRGRRWKGHWDEKTCGGLIEIPAIPISRSKVARLLSCILCRLITRILIFMLRPAIVQAECHEAAALVVNLNFPGRLYIDIHGAAPEEAAYSRRGRVPYDNSIVDWMNRTEEAIMQSADRLILVSEGMSRHLQEKWKVVRDERTVIVPVFSSARFFAPIDKCLWRKKLKVEHKTVFVYSGGMQKYQCIEETLVWFRAIRNRLNDAHLFIFTADVQTAKRLVVTEDASSIDIISVNEIDLPNLISIADFGFVLREDELLNRVSAPTKAVEYVSRGVRLLCTASAGNAPDLAKMFDAGIVIPLEFNNDALEVLIEEIIRTSALKLDQPAVNSYISRSRFKEAIVDLYSTNH